MVTQLKDLPQRTSAKIAGFGLLGMFLFGLFASGPNSSGSYDVFANSNSTLRMNIAADVMMLVFDVVAAFGLYYFLKPISAGLSLLAAWFRLMHVAIYGASLVNLLKLLYLLTEADLPSVDIKEQAMTLLHGHEFGFLLGLAFFGFHIALLGFLIIRSASAPNWLGYLLLFVAIGYVFNSMAAFLSPDYPEYQTALGFIVFIPAIIAELSLALWLIFRAGKANARPNDQGPTTKNFSV